MESDDAGAARYDPEMQEVGALAGLAMNVARPGDNVKVRQTGFFSSYDDDHRPYFGQILGQFAGLGRRPNELLVVIRDSKARIHKAVPLMLMVRAKDAIRSGRAVYEDQILDIEEVRFRDALFEVDIRDGDKIVWLFRVDWSFGLYFDFSGTLETADLWKTLGQCWRAMHFHAVYAFFDDPANPDRLIDRGWFPFVQLSTEEFRQLRHGIGEPSELEAIENHIVDAFSADRIDRVSRSWWVNPAFRDKRAIIEAGLNAYKEGGAEQVINCIKNLVSEVDGIVRLHFHRSMGRRPSMSEFMAYVLDLGRDAYPSSGSLAFPELFRDYLERFLFRAFDIEGGMVELSRHSVTHGVAEADEYTRKRALQVILSLDQIHHYIMSSKQS